MKSTYMFLIAILLFCQEGFCLPLINRFKSASNDSVRLDSEYLADRLSSKLGYVQDEEMLVKAFEKIKEFQASRPALVNVSTKEAGFIVCVGANAGVVILSFEAAVCSDLSGRIYVLSIGGTGPAFNLTANILVGYVQSQGPDLSGRFNNYKGYYNSDIRGSVGGAWLLLGARAIYFKGESDSYIGLAGWEVGAGGGVTSDAKVELTRQN